MDFFLEVLRFGLGVGGSLDDGALGNSLSRGDCKAFSKVRELPVFLESKEDE